MKKDKVNPGQIEPVVKRFILHLCGIVVLIIIPLAVIVDIMLWHLADSIKGQWQQWRQIFWDV